jgi:DNA helicase II / ATP-dependent DNA helicase PcrA
VWETERPFELHLPTAIVSGRADVILDVQGGEQRRLAIVDYKTFADESARDDYELQLAVYAGAGRREGLAIEAAYVHDLKAADRQPLDVSLAAITASEQTVETSVTDLRQGIFHARPRPPLRRPQPLGHWLAPSRQGEWRHAGTRNLEAAGQDSPTDAARASQ